MALLDDVIGSWGGGLFLGLGAAFFTPPIAPLAGSVLRPVAKTLIRGVLFVSDSLSGIVGDASEQVSDLVAEVRAAHRSHSKRPPVPSQH